MSDGKVGSGRTQRLINNGAGLAVMALCGTLIWAITTGNLSHAGTVVTTANGEDRMAPPPPPRFAPIGNADPDVDPSDFRFLRAPEAAPVVYCSFREPG
jgi:hypothetical protein